MNSWYCNTHFRSTVVSPFPPPPVVCPLRSKELIFTSYASVYYKVLLSIVESSEVAGVGNRNLALPSFSCLSAIFQIS